MPDATFNQHLVKTSLYGVASLRNSMLTHHNGDAMEPPSNVLKGICGSEEETFKLW
jgi:hypothetical protein